MNPLLVILCTHNPRPDFLDATLAALRAQTLPAAEWQLLVVDNACAAPLAGALDLSWHPAARVVREEKLGTAHARHRALREARTAGASLILFVDDDNVLAPGYLATGLGLAADWPQLGAWGGELVPRFESPPPAWLERYRPYLAIAPLPADQWANHLSTYDAVPPTAGCFLRAAVWQRYLLLLAEDPRRLTLGARGNEQVRGEDTDLVLTTLDLGLGFGRFRRLQLEHLVPSGRLTPQYVAGLMEGIALGTGLLEYLRFQRVPRRPASPGLHLVRGLLRAWRTWRLPEPLRLIRRAELRGYERARRVVAVWRNTRPVPDAPALTTSVARSS